MSRFRLLHAAPLDDGPLLHRGPRRRSRAGAWRAPGACAVAWPVVKRHSFPCLHSRLSYGTFVNMNSLRGRCHRVCIGMP